MSTLITTLIGLLLLGGSDVQHQNLKTDEVYVLLGPQWNLRAQYTSWDKSRATYLIFQGEPVLMNVLF